MAASVIPVADAVSSSASSILESGKPFIIYGTAWKKDDTSRLVYKAIKSGFRFIDTACQPKHYNEEGVGEGIVAAMNEFELSRKDLFIQTKFTPYNGQDPERVPYDEDAPLEDQVLQSFEVSQRNLRTEFIDSLILHSPLETHEETMRVWRVFEQKVKEGSVGQIGISNCYSPHKFEMLWNEAEVKPAVLQNRFYAQSGFDVELRRFCKQKDIWYQSFWTFSSLNSKGTKKKEVREMAEEKGLTPETLVSYMYVLPLHNYVLSDHFSVRVL